MVVGGGGCGGRGEPAGPSGGEEGGDLLALARSQSEAEGGQARHLAVVDGERGEGVAVAHHLVRLEPLPVGAKEAARDGQHRVLRRLRVRRVVTARMVARSVRSLAPAPAPVAPPHASADRRAPPTKISYQTQEARTQEAQAYPHAYIPIGYARVAARQVLGDEHRLAHVLPHYRGGRGGRPRRIMAAPIGPARQEARGIFRPPLLRSDLVPLLRRRRRRHGAVVVRSPPPRGRGGSSRLPLAGGQQRDEIVLLHHAHDGQVRARLLHARRAQLRPSRANQTPLVSVARRQSTQYSVRRVAG
eukprot:611272-Prorocentrum_minimum.AAC.1